MSGSITKVWDTGGTAFNTMSRLKSLIAAVTVENVQPQAVLAAEALGFGIHVRDELLVEALRALKGNDNIRWDNLKLLIGIRSGELHKTMRNSTSLSSFFLFVCACKICFTDVDIGELAYQMIAASGVLKNYPVAAFQLCDLIKTFSGHAEELAPDKLLHALAVKISERSPLGVQLSSQLNKRNLGDLLIRAFALLNDESVERITLTGGTNGLWLATFFSWLIEGKVCVSVDGQMLPDISIDGQVSTCDIKSSKLSLELKNSFGTGSYSHDWVIREWREGQPADFVIEDAVKNSSSYCQYMPLNMTSVFLRQLYQSQYQGYQEALEFRVDLVRGGLAGAFIVLLSRFGSIYEPANCCWNLGKSCTTSPLWDILPEKWLEVYESATTQYGWSESAIVQAQENAFAFLEPAFGEQADRLADHEQVWERIKAIASEFIISELGNDFSDEREEREDEISRVFDPAAYVAVNAVATATCDFHSGVQRITPPSEVRWGSTKEFFGFLLSSRGMEISKFREYTFAKALPGGTTFDANDVVISSDGYTAGIYALWDLCNTQKRNALAVRVCTGAIQYEDHRYDSIGEDKRDTSADRFPDRDFEKIKLFEDTKYLGLYPEPDQDGLRIKHLMAKAGRRLELKSYLTASEKYLNPVSWTESICGLAVAVHFQQTIQPTERQEKDLIQAHAETLGQVYWQSVRDWGHQDLGGKTILRTLRDQNLRFFSCGIIHQERRKRVLNDCHKIVLRQQGSLMLSVLAAQDLSDSWTVIC